MRSTPHTVIRRTYCQHAIWLLLCLAASPDQTTMLSYVSYESTHVLTWLHTIVWILEINDIDVQDWTSDNCVIQIMYLVVLIQVQF